MRAVRPAGLSCVNTESKDLTCDLAALRTADLAVVDALARLKRAAARHGVRLALRNAGGPLRELIAFSGLADVLPVDGGGLPIDGGVLPVEPDGAGLPDLGQLLPGRQPRRQPEQREQHIGVEEVGEPRDPAL
ncbi:STAS domain-containing protein [Kitasatospora sp. NPDC093806]|uniref:STAS domain-containing protein n=1 Tax=Kitasatospora sp. NPDC093806 TaxID=3155075 RepID=UPI00341A473C